MATAGFRERPGEEEDGHLQAARPPDSQVAPHLSLLGNGERNSAFSFMPKPPPKKRAGRPARSLLLARWRLAVTHRPARTQNNGFGQPAFQDQHAAVRICQHGAAVRESFPARLRVGLALWLWVTAHGSFAIFAPFANPCKPGSTAQKAQRRNPSVSREEREGGEGQDDSSFQFSAKQRRGSGNEFGRKERREHKGEM